MGVLYGARFTKMNTLMIIANVLYFLFIEWVGSSLDTAVMLHLGASYYPKIVFEGEYYRLFTAMFMHFGVSHLANNMLVLFMLGDNLERALGSLKFTIVYILCGAGANVVSLYFGSRLAVGAGASGAVFGVIGALLWAVIRNRGRLEDITGRQLLIMTGISLYYGFTSTGIDNAAHIGGFIIGFLLSILLYRKPAKRSRIDELYGREF